MQSHTHRDIWLCTRSGLLLPFFFLLHYRRRCDSCYFTLSHFQWNYVSRSVFSRQQSHGAAQSKSVHVTESIASDSVPRRYNSHNVNDVYDRYENSIQFHLISSRVESIGCGRAVFFPVVALWKIAKRSLWRSKKKEAHKKINTQIQNLMRI